MLDKLDKEVQFVAVWVRISEAWVRSMTFRLLFFFMTAFLLFAWGLRKLHIPLDGVLAFLLVLMPLVVALFAHYRRIGRLRTLNQTARALWHLRFWRLLLPKEAYVQLRLSILVETDFQADAPDFTEAQVLQEIAAAEEAGALALPFLFGFRAEIARRQDDWRRAETQLKLGLEETPPGVLRTGLLAQLARLYALHMPNKRMLKEANRLLDEAYTYVSQDAHRQLLHSIRGEVRLAQGEATEAVKLLQDSLEALLDSAVARPATESTWDQLSYKIRYSFAQMTYSQQDEHQFPFYAELCLSLGKAHLKCKQRDEAIAAYRKGLSLCKQPFIEQQLREALEALGED